jgi:hypothetical protein
MSWGTEVMKRSPLGILATLILLAAIAIFVVPKHNDVNIPSATSGNKNDDTLAPGSVNLINYSWRKGGFDTVMIASFTIQNKNDFAIKDIDVVCELSARSGTVIGYTAKTIYDTVPAHGRKTFRELNMGSGVSFDFGQAESAFCKIGAMSRS